MCQWCHRACSLCGPVMCVFALFFLVSGVVLGPCRLFSLSFVCCNCCSFVCLNVWATWPSFWVLQEFSSKCRFQVLFGRGLTNVIGGCFPFFVCIVLINGLSHWWLVVGYALQVFPVVTRLTVYRRLQVFVEQLLYSALLEE